MLTLIMTLSSTASDSQSTMTLGLTTGDFQSIFEDGKLKPGIYKIQNLYSQTYMEIHEHSREVCCRPAASLEEGRGLVRPFLVACGACV